jgi:Holliday junction resolvase-like predicted endonuclease
MKVRSIWFCISGASGEVHREQLKLFRLVLHYMCEDKTFQSFCRKFDVLIIFRKCERTIPDVNGLLQWKVSLVYS